VVDDDLLTMDRGERIKKLNMLRCKIYKISPAGWAYGRQQRVIEERCAHAWAIH